MCYEFEFTNPALYRIVSSTRRLGNFVLNVVIISKIIFKNDRVFVVTTVEVPF